MTSRLHARRGQDDLLLSKKEAAQHLGVPFKALKPLVRQGVLEPVKSAGKTWFYLSDVNNAAHVISKKIDVVTANHNALRALSMATRLERQMTVMMFMLGARKQFEPLTVERIRSDWDTVLDNVHRDFADIDTSELLEWARLFFAVDEAYLMVAGDVTAHAEPWLPYMKIGETILRHKQESGDKEKKAAYEYLLVAHRSMRTAAYFYCRRSYGARTANKTFPDSQDADIVSSVLAIIDQAVDPTDGRPIL